MRNRWGWLFVGTILAAGCGGDAGDDLDTGAVEDTTLVSPAGQGEAVGVALDGPTPVGAMDVQISDANGQVVGAARLTETAEGVQVHVVAAGLPPGDHGIHVHAAGLCEPPGFESAGPHFAAGSKQHGLENPQGPHEGDMPNLTIGADGRGTGTFVLRGAQLHGTTENGLMREGGTSIIIHAGPDDMRTDPSGNSGARIACGLISM